VRLLVEKEELSPRHSRDRALPLTSQEIVLKLSQHRGMEDAIRIPNQLTLDSLVRRIPSNTDLPQRILPRVEQ